MPRCAGSVGGRQAARRCEGCLVLLWAGQGEPQRPRRDVDHTMMRLARSRPAVRPLLPRPSTHARAHTHTHAHFRHHIAHSSDRLRGCDRLPDAACTEVERWKAWHEGTRNATKKLLFDSAGMTHCPAQHPSWCCLPAASAVDLTLPLPRLPLTPSSCRSAVGLGHQAPPPHTCATLNSSAQLPASLPHQAPPPPPPHTQ